MPMGSDLKLTRIDGLPFAQFAQLIASVIRDDLVRCDASDRSVLRPGA
jgi:hypothetical protein